MKTHLELPRAALLLCLLCSSCASAPPARPTSPWASESARLADLKAFDHACFITVSPSGHTETLGRSCDERLPPQSTFKIPNALIGLETGAIPGVDHVIPYDGHAVPFEAWAKDHTLSSAVESSVVWYFQALATRVGEAQMEAWLKRLKYPDADISGGLT